MNGKGKGYGGSDATGGCGAMYGNASTAGYGCYPAAGYGMTPQMASAGYGQPPVAAYGMTAVNGGSSYGSAAGAYGTMAAGGYGAPPPVGSAFGAPVATANMAQNMRRLKMPTAWQLQMPMASLEAPALGLLAGMMHHCMVLSMAAIDQRRIECSGHNCPAMPCPVYP